MKSGGARNSTFDRSNCTVWCKRRLAEGKHSNCTRGLIYQGFPSNDEDGISLGAGFAIITVYTAYIVDDSVEVCRVMGVTNFN